MSRVGKSPVKLPANVTLDVASDFITVKGPKGELKQFTMPEVNLKVEDGEVTVTRINDDKIARSKHGLMRALVANMVKGTSEGFTKKLEINGVGYRVNLAGTDLKFNLGYSHDITYKLPEGITANVDQNTIVINGIDKQKVGQVAAEIRSLRKPEPYKGKGIKYADERIIRKSGKSGKE